MEEKFHEAYLLLARIAACVGAWISGLPNVKLMEDGTVKDANGRVITRLEPGMIGLLPSGAKVEIPPVNIPPPSFNETIAGMGRRMAAGLGVSYSLVSRDFSRATFSSNRAEQLEDRKGYRPVQRIIWHRHSLPFWRRRIAWAIRTGEITLTAAQRAAWLSDPDRLLKMKPNYPGWDWVDPKKQADAAKIEKDEGFKSVPEIIEERGGDWREVIRQQIEFEKFEAAEREKAGLPPRQPPAASGAPGGGGTDEVREDDETDREDEETRARVIAEDHAAREGRLAILNGHHATTDGSGNGTHRPVS
jgi:capsid protein